MVQIEDELWNKKAPKASIYRQKLGIFRFEPLPTLNRIEFLEKFEELCRFLKLQRSTIGCCLGDNRLLDHSATAEKETIDCLFEKIAVWLI